MTIGSLFSGIGGLELGLEWAGLGPVAWQVESDARCRRVLARHWPAADRSVEDVRDAGAATLAPVEIVAGGFPCQDVSAAGRGAGLDGARSGLWWEFRRVVDELGPRVVVVENVASGARRWLCAVRSSLHELGYRTRALGVGACDVGAPHLRRRVFVVAYADRYRQLEPGGYIAQRGGRAIDGGQLAHPLGGELRLQPGRGGGARGPEAPEPRGGGEGVADPHGERLDRGPELLAASGAGRLAGPQGDHPRGAAQPGMGGGAHGLPGGLDRAPGRWPAGRGEDQHPWEPPRTLAGVRDRPARLKALGNAVVPQCAYVVGLAIRADLEAGA